MEDTLTIVHYLFPPKRKPRNGWRLFNAQICWWVFFSVTGGWFGDISWSGLVVFRCFCKFWYCSSPVCVLRRKLTTKRFPKVERLVNNTKTPLKFANLVISMLQVEWLDVYIHCSRIGLGASTLKVTRPKEGGTAVRVSWSVSGKSYHFCICDEIYKNSAHVHACWSMFRNIP